MFHVRRRPADSQPRRRKKKAGSTSNPGSRTGSEPLLVEVAPDGSPLENARRIRLNDVLEVGSGNGMGLQLYGPSIQARHCVLASADGGGGGYCITPLHADALLTLNGQRVYHTARLQHGAIVKFGRVSTFRFVDPAQETILNRNLSQSQHFGSGSIYDRSPTSPVPDNTSGAMSPSTGSHTQSGMENHTESQDYQRTMSPVSQHTLNQEFGYKDGEPYNNNTLKMENDSLMMSHLNESKEDLIRDEFGNYPEQDSAASAGRKPGSQYKDNYETTFDLDGNVETKSICSAKSGGSGHDSRVSGVSGARPGQEAILPAVLEFPEPGQAHFLAAVITRLDPHSCAFKLAPVYTLYLCARYRASTHYRPELTPTERAHKLTAFLHHVATLVHATVQEKFADSAAQAFWMANASELLHFLKCDRHISSFSTQAQDLLPATVQAAFSNLVSCLQEEVGGACAGLVGADAEVGGAGGAGDAAAPCVRALAAAMVLLRRCRVNAALTIQLFSHLFHYINAVAFNKLVAEAMNGRCSARVGAALAGRLALLGQWAERQGLELAADCHLARVHQAARLIQGEYRSADEVRAAVAACFKLNSVQVRALLTPLVSPELVEAGVQHARTLADELYRADNREIQLEESEWLGVGLLIPGDGFSAEVVRGVPPGLADFLAPLQRAGLCRLAHQPHALGVWTVYMTGYGAQHPTRRPQEPRVQLIQLNKNSNGMGLSIVAAKGAGQSRLGIYIKSVVAGGAAAADGRLAAGDQLLSVDGHSLVGITQEKAAEYLVRTGPTVTLEVAKQGAVLHGLATLLHQPAYNNNRPGARRASERDLPSRLAAEPVKPSKSTPALHQVTSPLPHHHQTLNRSGQMNGAAVGAGAGAGAAPAGTGWPHKSRSSHNLSSVPQPQPQPQHQSQTLPQHAHQDTFYQNLSSVHNINDRWSVARSSGGASGGGGGGAARPQSTLLSPHPLSPTPSDHHSEFNSSMSVRAAKLAEMSEEVTRRQLHQQEMQQQQLLQQQMMQQPPNQHLLQTQQQMMQTQQQQMMQTQQQQPMMQTQQQQMMQTQQQQMMQTQQQQMMQTQQQQMMHMMSQQQMPQQRYEWSQPGPPSPQRAQPPVAPKPQSVRRSDVEADAGANHQQQHQTSTLQPDDEWYVASALEPPAMTVYGVRGATGVGAGGGAGATAAPPNPWAREEREREQEARHNVHRARRDASIAALVALGPQRTPTQSQQLRALQLERDFERRAAQLSQEEGPTTPVGGGGEFPRAAPLSPGAPAPVPTAAPAPALAPSSQDTPPPLPPQPKSILKTNRQELTNGVHHEQIAESVGAGAGAGVGGVSRVAGGLGALSLSEAPPPPPERGSSFAVMSAVRAQVGGNGAMSPSGSAREGPAGSVTSSGGGGGTGPGTGTPPRDKRVSFHEQPPPPPDTLPPPLDLDDAPQAPHTPHQDPDRFIEEAESMLNTPPTPTTPTAITHTPGVIGAQEVYRDPRTRQLAEKQKAQSSGPAVPEALSFKEKMKMFALESGESHTPKDKVKISRAQRDIDAVR